MRYLIKRRGTVRWHIADSRPPVGVRTLCGQIFMEGNYQSTAMTEWETHPSSTCRSCLRLEGAR